VSGTAWVNEVLYPAWGQRFACKAEIARVRSQHQDILVFDSASHGRVLMLDGVVQITEADEFVYQEMMAHVPLLNHGDAARVLVIGGGDGGILRRVLQHRGVRRAVLVEIDEQVIALSKAHLPASAATPGPTRAPRWWWATPSTTCSRRPRRASTR
jgi:spermidine synthase